MGAFALFTTFEITLAQVVAFVTLLGGLAFVIGFIWYRFRQGDDKSKDKAIANLRTAFDSEHTLRVLAEEKAGRLVKELEAEKQERQGCEQALKDIGRFNLRLQAREEKYQAAINRLERRLSIPETNFADFGIHASET